MLEWAGISFGEENTIRLQKSIKVCVILVAKRLLAKHYYLNLTVLFFICRDWPS